MKKYQKRLNRLNRLTDDLLLDLKKASEQCLRKAPVEGAWTPLQTFYHIHLSERHCVEYLLYKYGQEDTSFPKASFRTRASGKLLSLALMSPLKFRAPKGVDVNRISSQENLTVASVSHEIRNTRHELMQLFAQMPAAWEKAATFKHPSVGRITLNDMMLFLTIHHQRHARQIRRALAQNSRNNRR